MHRFARSFFGIAVLGSLMMTDTARPEALNAGLRQRMDKAEAEEKRLRSERNESVALVKRAEALLAKALRDGDDASAATIQEAITKAQSAIVACDAGITAAEGRVEALTGTLKTVEAMSVRTVISSSMVDLRDVKDFTLDPAKVKGYARSMQERLNGEKATTIHDEIKARVGKQKTSSNLATMSYAELMASLDGEAVQGLKQGVSARQKDADAKLRLAFQLPDDSEEELLDLILPPEPAKPTPLQQAMQQVKGEALRLLHYFDYVQHDEKDRVFDAYQAWKTETGTISERLNANQISVKEYEAAYKLQDAKFLFRLTMIGGIASEKEDAEIEATLPASKKGGAK
ncbi:MAG: hypothetical protein JNM65_06585 [Verrucomicrobiaceae bacterium]|nr:hypothetical protein [Verrucomicrobiaceae bacterium]